VSISVDPNHEIISIHSPLYLSLSGFNFVCTFVSALLLLGVCQYLLTQIEYEGFRKCTEYHCSILLGVF
jgi:hypothetical protein